MTPPHKTHHKKDDIPRPRDEEGHFAPSDSEIEKRISESEQIPTPTASTNPGLISRFFSNASSVEKTKDDDTLLNVHIGNPLKKITELLEEIKKQKAFSFTLKGSLGIMGVALVLSLFGIFGGTKMLCDKGVQSHIGNIRILAIKNVQTSTVPFIGPVIDFYTHLFNPKVTENRVILITTNNTTIHLPHFPVSTARPYLNQTIIATGPFDSCSQTLVLKEPAPVEFLR